MTTPPANPVSVGARASAPGSLMLFGEHAVLHGHLAIACAIDKRITVTARRRADGRVRVQSALGTRECPIRHLDLSPPLQFVMETIADGAMEFPEGLDLTVASEIRDDQGLGSSAAVVVATQAAMDALHGRVRSHRELQNRCRAIVRRVQGIGSGADVAASILGGVITYRADPVEMNRIASEMALVAAYSGAKEKTAVVVAQVEALRKAHHEPVERVFRAMDGVARAAASAMATGNWRGVGEMLNFGHGLMDAIGVNTPRLQELIDALRAAPGVLGAKISGSGRGDCVIALGEPDPKALPFPLLPIRVSSRGVEQGPDAG